VVAKRGRKPTENPPAVRMSASLSPEIYSALQEIAKRKKVSLAWVIRDAAEKYIGDQTRFPEERR
jgi:predicted transcriptional regulator